MTQIGGAAIVSLEDPAGTRGRWAVVGYPTHQSILVFDVEGFGDPHRNNNAQAAVRDEVYQVLAESMDSAGVPWQACAREDRGDGAIVLVPPEISKVLLLDPLLGCL